MSSRRRAPPRKRTPNPRSQAGAYVLDSRHQEFDTLFALCSSGEDYISVADFLMILQALNLLFEESELMSFLQESVVGAINPEVFPVTLPVYQTVLNLCLRAMAKKLSVQRDEDFAIFADDDNNVDVAYLKRVTSQIGDKLSHDQFDTFFEELKDHIVDGKIPAQVLYDFTKCQ